jgi:hypothetical protein
MLPTMLTLWGVITALQGWRLSFRSVARLILPQHFGPQLRQQLALTITIYRQYNTSCAFKPAHWHSHHSTHDEAARTPGLFMSYFMLVGLATHFNMTSSVCPELEMDSEPRGALAIATVGVRRLSSSLPLCVITFSCRLSARSSSGSRGFLLPASRIVRKRQNSRKTTGASAPWTTLSLSTN